MNVTRLALLGMNHEANTFSPHVIDRARWEIFGTRRGEDLVAHYGQSRSTVAGYLAAGKWDDVQVVPLAFTQFTPAGQITAEVFDEIVGELLQLLRDNGPFDGVLLALHGAAVSEEFPDADGRIARLVRETVGDVPIGVSSDMHANISPEMVAASDVLATYRTNPHVDAYERAIEVADLIVRAARGQVRPTQTLRQVPAAINIMRQYTSVEPMSGILKELATVLDTPGVLTATVAEGYPYADVEEMGMSAVVVTHDDPELAARLADELAAAVWARREEFGANAATAAGAVASAAAATDGPVLLLDVGDNIGGGSPGDSVVLLAESVRQAAGPTLVTIFDPESAAVARAAGVGNSVDLNVGGKIDPDCGPPVPFTGTVTAVHDGKYADTGPTHGGQMHFDAGDTAAVQASDGTVVVLTSKLVGAYSAAHFPLLGIDPRSFRIIIAKGVQSPLASYGPLAKQIVQVDTPGVTSADLSRFTYHRRRRPLYPFEADASL
jgi:microcystin degradation protein MlrC